MIYRKFFKRFFDVLVGLIGVIVFFPFFVIVFIALTINNRGTPFFYQERPGLNEKIFKIIKFKTMNDKKDKDGNLLPDSVRLTKVGQFIRKTSLDELPQIINLLKGDMSIIGPRPLLPEYLPYYNQRQNKRHTVRPGISGWAQVNGRNAISWDQKLEYDAWYVENLTILLDAKIFLITFLKVFKSEGISKNGHVSMPTFIEYTKNKKMIRVLVTGAGALLGQGILRSLKMGKNKYFIVSADPSAYSTGHTLANKSYLLPFANDSNYIDRVSEIIFKEKIEYVFIGTDVELPIFSKNKQLLESKYNVKVFVSSEEVIEISNDKMKTAIFLKNNGFPYPLSAMSSDIEGIQELKKNGDYPYIAKPADGARSKGIKMINNEDDLNEISSYKNNLVVQEYITEDDGEYTTGCIIVDGKCMAVVSMVRDLRDGNTWRAYRNEKTNIYDELIKEIANKLNADGAINFQYRIKNGKPVIFEINGRFSGTTPLRAMFGFNEVEALINYFHTGKEIQTKNLKNGVILRTFSDLLVENETIESFSKKRMISSFDSEYFPFKK